VQLHRCDRNLLEVVEREVNANLEALAQLTESAAPQNVDEYRRIFHAMKGSARQLGILAFSKMALEAEQAMKEVIKSGSTSDVAATVRTRSIALASEWRRVLALSRFTSAN
jgi:chemotaxis protein histidine kinase CheA